MSKAAVPSDASMDQPPAPGDRQAVGPTLTVLDRILDSYGPRDFAIRLWDGTLVPPDPGLEARFTLVLNRPGVLRRWLLPPNELALGESYLDGSWDLEGDMVAAMRLGDVFEGLALRADGWLGFARQVMALPKDPPHPNGDGGNEDALERFRDRFRGVSHTRERDREAITYHYDVGNDFYSLWLDGRMVYSCAYFPTGREDLDTAQEAKLEHICRKLRLRPGERLLDIGCGWGGLIMYAAERYGVDATGITLSQAQADMATQRIAAAGLRDRCRAIILDYRDLASLGPFDKMVSVGMVEHVGKARFHDYFLSAWRGLGPGGLFLNHGITSSGRELGSYGLLDHYLFRRGAFMRKYVFPDSEVRPLGENLDPAERVGFEVRDVECWREHYAQTLRHWVRRLEEHREEAVSQVGERAYRLWRLYMAGCSHAFDTARLSVHQCLLAKPDSQGSVELPRTRGDLYAPR